VLLLRPRDGYAKYCDQRVCLCSCLSTCSNFTKLSTSKSTVTDCLISSAKVIGAVAVWGAAARGTFLLQPLPGRDSVCDHPDWSISNNVVNRDLWIPFSTTQRIPVLQRTTLFCANMRNYIVLIAVLKTPKSISQHLNASFWKLLETRHRASTSMYSLTFRVRVTTHPQYGRNGTAHAAGVSMLSLARGVVAGMRTAWHCVRWAWRITAGLCHAFLVLP